MVTKILTFRRNGRGGNDLTKKKSRFIFKLLFYTWQRVMYSGFLFRWPYRGKQGVWELLVFSGPTYDLCVPSGSEDVQGVNQVTLHH